MWSQFVTSSCRTLRLKAGKRSPPEIVLCCVAWLGSTPWLSHHRVWRDQHRAHLLAANEEDQLSNIFWLQDDGHVQSLTETFSKGYEEKRVAFVRTDHRKAPARNPLLSLIR